MEQAPQSSVTWQAAHSPQPTRLNILCSRLKAILCARQSLHNVLSRCLREPSPEKRIPQFSQHPGAGNAAGGASVAALGSSLGTSFLTSPFCGLTSRFRALAGFDAFFRFLLGVGKEVALGAG